MARSPRRSTSRRPSTTAAKVTSEAAAGQIQGFSLTGLRPVRQPIPRAADGVQQRGLEALVDFLAQAADVGVDQAGVRVEAIVPEFLQHHGPCHHPVLVAEEVLQELELTGQEVEAAAGAADPALQE